MHITRFQDVTWHVPTSAAVSDLDARAADDEPGRKFLVSGEAGFYLQTVRLPPDFGAPVHHHDHAELFMVLEGSCILNGEPLGRYDLAVIDAGEHYGFTAGPQGVVFAVYRRAAAIYTEAES